MNENLQDKRENKPRGKKSDVRGRFSMIWNYCLAGIKLLIGIGGLSLFLCIGSLYSFGIGAAKQVYFRGCKYRYSELSELKYFLGMSIALMLTSLLYSFYMIRLFFYPSSFQYGIVTAAVLTVVAFSDLITSIIDLLKTRHHGDLLLSGLKSVNLAAALASLVLAQVAILSILDYGVHVSPFNALSGLVCGALCIGISIVMLIKYRSGKQKASQKAKLLLADENDRLL